MSNNPASSKETPVGELLNIGPKTAAWLRELGIHTLADLQSLGLIEVYMRLRAARPGQVSLNALWALQGALLDLPWSELPPELKSSLEAHLSD